MEIHEFDDPGWLRAASEDRPIWSERPIFLLPLNPLIAASQKIVASQIRANDQLPKRVKELAFVGEAGIRL